MGIATLEDLQGSTGGGHLPQDVRGDRGHLDRRRDPAGRRTRRPQGRRDGAAGRYRVDLGAGAGARSGWLRARGRGRRAGTARCRPACGQRERAPGTATAVDPGMGTAPATASGTAMATALGMLARSWRRLRQRRRWAAAPTPATMPLVVPVRAQPVAVAGRAPGADRAARLTPARRHGARGPSTSSCGSGPRHCPSDRHRWHPGRGHRSHSASCPVHRPSTGWYPMAATSRPGPTRHGRRSRARSRPHATGVCGSGPGAPRPLRASAPGSRGGGVRDPCATSSWSIPARHASCSTSPSARGRAQEMPLRLGVAYDAELLADVHRRLGSMVELELA